MLLALNPADMLGHCVDEVTVTFSLAFFRVSNVCCRFGLFVNAFSISASTSLIDKRLVSGIAAGSLLKSILVLARLVSCLLACLSKVTSSKVEHALMSKVPITERNNGKSFTVELKLVKCDLTVTKRGLSEG